MLPFVCVLERARKQKQRHEEGAETLHAWQRMRKQALMGWKQPRHKCAQSYHHKKECKERLGNNRKITHAGQELTEHENEKQLTEIALTASKKLEKHAKINRMPTPLVNQHSINSTALKVERQMLHDFFSSLFSCGAHSARNGQGQTSELRVPGCAACSGMRVFIYGCVLCAFGLGLWQMLDADGWCLLMVLYMVLSDILADRYMARKQQVR